MDADAPAPAADAPAPAAAASAPAAAAGRVFDNADLVHEIAKRIADPVHLVRFGAITKTTHDAYRRQNPGLALPRFADVPFRKLGKHTRRTHIAPYVWRGRAPYDHGGTACVAISNRYMARFPTKDSLLAKMDAYLHVQKTKRHDMEDTGYTLGRLALELERVVNGIFIGGVDGGGVQHQLTGVIQWLRADGVYARCFPPEGWIFRPSLREQADLLERLFERLRLLSYRALYITLVSLKVFTKRDV